MSKKKAAFWLKDFDEEKILQRRYFKKFELPPLTDTEILKSLQTSSEEDIASMEQKLSVIKALHEQAQNFNNLLTRYSERLKKVAGKTYGEFLTATMATAELIQSLQQLYYTVENAIQKHYRRIFTERLRQYRKAAKMTQRELAERVNVSPQLMSLYARGEHEITIHTLVRVARVLNVSIDKLLKG